jgi:3-hydroxybutyryl-CoA dehydratase
MTGSSITFAEDDIGYTIDKLEVGMSRSYAKTVTEADILMFAAASGDMNAVHLNQEFAEHTTFHGRIAHGLLTAGIVSACIGNKLPGLGTIYLSQSLRFKAPVHPGETVRAIVTVKSIDVAKNRVVLDTVCQVHGNTVLEGEATVLAPRRPQEAPKA